jgi:hypothetical protein
MLTAKENHHSQAASNYWWQHQYLEPCPLSTSTFHPLPFPFPNPVASMGLERWLLEVGGLLMRSYSLPPVLGSENAGNVGSRLGWELLLKDGWWNGREILEGALRI